MLTKFLDPVSVVLLLMPPPFYKELPTLVESNLPYSLVAVFVESILLYSFMMGFTTRALGPAVPDALTPNL